jgi:hypothetical protein
MNIIHAGVVLHKGCQGDSNVRCENERRGIHAPEYNVQMPPPSGSALQPVQPGYIVNFEIPCPLDRSTLSIPRILSVGTNWEVQSRQQKEQSNMPGATTADVAVSHETAQSGIVRVVLVEPHIVVRNGLAWQCARLARIEVVAACGDIDEVFQATKPLAAHVCVVGPSISTRESIAFMRRAHMQSPRLAVVVIQGHPTHGDSVTNCYSCVWQSGGYRMHINNTRWLADTMSTMASQCGGYQTCWVEVGNIATADPLSGTLTQRYYWADNRPCNGGYWPHYGGISLNDNGYTAGASIAGNGSDACGIPPNTWSISISGPTAGISGTSTNNPMLPNIIQLGGEIEGEPRYQQHAGTVDFTYNEYRQTADGRWYYFGGNSSEYQYQQDGPWSSYWQTPPQNSSTGGDWYTYCPC